MLGAMLTDLVGFPPVSASARASADHRGHLVFLAARNARGGWPSGSSISEQIAEQKKAEAIPWKVILPAAFVIFTSRFIERGLVAATTPLWMAGLFGKARASWVF